MRLFIIAFLISASEASRASYVKNLSDFKNHCALHRERVVVLGRALRSNFYPEVDTRVLENYLNLHDAAKVSNHPYIYKAYGFEEAPSEILFRHYGQTIQKDQNSNLNQAIKMLGVFDEQLRSIFFQTFGNTHASELREIEMIADLVDRGLDPVAREEFGREMLKASQIFSDTRILIKVIWLEDAYHRIVKNLNYRPSDDKTCVLQLM